MSTSFKNYTIHCYKPGIIETVEVPYPVIDKDEVIIQSIYTGICRTDVDIFEGKSEPLPFGMFGHEGFGIIVDAHENYSHLIGEYVASRSDMAYAQYYKSNMNEFTVLWGLNKPHPKYILEPVACAYNIAQHVGMLSYHNLILGNGFLSRCVEFFVRKRIMMDPVIVANNHFEEGNLSVFDVQWDHYTTIIDCSGRIEIPVEKLSYNTHLIMASKLQYNFNTDFGNHLWKAVKMSFPSPRSENFTMNIAGIIPSFLGEYWTHTDKFENAQALFEASVNRDKNFKRSYISYE